MECARGLLETLELYRFVAERTWAGHDQPESTEEVPVAREQRKLAMVLAAGVVRYSRLMGGDESGTLRLSRPIIQILSSTCQPHAHAIRS